MVNQKLLAFVKKMLKLGISKSTIRTKILQQGWSAEEANSALELAINPRPLASYTMPPKKTSVPQKKPLQRVAKYCPRCNRQLVKAGEYARCPNCDIFCEKCGELFVALTIKTCPKCGGKVHISQERLNIGTQGMKIWVVGSFILTIILGFITSYLGGWATKAYEKFATTTGSLEFIAITAPVAGVSYIIAMISGILTFLAYFFFSLSFVGLYKIKKARGFKTETQKILFKVGLVLIVCSWISIFLVIFVL